MALTVEQAREQLVLSLQSNEEDERCSALAAFGGYGPAAASLEMTGDVARMLNDPSTAVQLESLSALSKIGELAADVAPDVVLMLQRKDTEVLVGACDVLCGLGEAGAMHSGDVLPLLQHADAEVRAAAVSVLGSSRAQKHMKDVAECLNDKATTVVLHASRALANFGEAASEYTSEVVTITCKSENPDVRCSGVEFMAAAGSQACHARREELCKAVSDPDLMVRQAAVAAFTMNGSELASFAKDLVAHLASEDGRTRIAAVMCLAGMREAAGDHAAAVAALAQDDFEDREAHMMAAACVIKKPSVSMRFARAAVATALSMMGPEGAKFIGAVAELLNDSNEHVRQCAIISIANMGKAASRYEAKLLELCSDRSVPVASSALESLGKVAMSRGRTDVSTIAAVAKQLKHQHPGVRAAAATCLGRMGPKAAAHVEPLMKCLSDRASQVRVAAMGAFPQLGPRGHVYAPEVARLAFDPLWPVRAAAVEALGQMGERGAAFADELVGLLSDPAPEVRIAALGAISDMGEDAKPLQEAIDALKADGLKAVREAAAEASRKIAAQ